MSKSHYENKELLAYGITNAGRALTRLKLDRKENLAKFSRDELISYQQDIEALFSELYRRIYRERNK